MKYRAVEVVDKKTHEVKHTIPIIPPKTAGMAEKVQESVGTNLDWDLFYTRLVPADE